MIVVVGEALVDLVVAPDGSVTSALGGAPFNTARACGRLGVAVQYVGCLSHDRFGSLALQRLSADGVGIEYVTRTAVPTTLAVAELDPTGSAAYRFYVEGTSITQPVAAPPGGVLYTGGLALAVEPLASSVEMMIEHADAPIVMIDVNARPAVIADRAVYLDRLERILPHADVVKASDEDLAYIAPDEVPADAARRIADAGTRAVLVTAGGSGVTVVTAAGDINVPVPPVAVVDTIGAGDTFSSGFLSWWTASGRDRRQLSDTDALISAVTLGCRLAGVVCQRRGADPPWRSELPPEWWPSS